MSRSMLWLLPKISLGSYCSIWQETIIKHRQKISHCTPSFTETDTPDSIWIVVTSSSFEDEVYNSSALQGPASGNTFGPPLRIRRGYAVWLIAVHLPHNNLKRPIHPLVWRGRQADQRTATNSISLLALLLPAVPPVAETSNWRTFIWFSQRWCKHRPN